MALLNQGKVPLSMHFAATVSQGGQECRVMMVDITERKREEKALRESEARYRTLIENIPQAVLLKDRESRYISINKAYALAFGLRQEEVIGKSDYDFHPKHFADKFRQEDRSVMETGKGREFEEESVHNGQKRFYHKVKVPVRDSMGKIIGVLSTLSDITERKQAEEALRALSARQEAILAAVPEIIMEVDCNKVYRWSNQAGVEFFGEDVIGKEAAFYFEGEQDTYATVQPLLNGNDEVFYVESLQRRRDGQKRLLAWWCRVLKNAQGTITGALSTARDITDHRRAEEELRESEARFRSLVESAPDAIFVQSAGRFAYLNSAACMLYGVSQPEDLLGTDFMERVAPEYRDKIREGIKLQRETGKPAPLMDQEYLRLDCSRVAVESTAVPIRYQGEDAHMVLIRDITERKQAEEALRESERFLRFTLDGLSDRIALLDEQGKILLVNKAWRKFAEKNGISSVSAVSEGSNYLQICDSAYGESSEEAGPFAEGIRDVLSGVKESYVLEYPCHSPDKKRWFVGRITPFPGDGPRRVVVAHEDITERKRADEALRESEERFRLGFENANIGMCLVDPEGRLIRVNRQMCEVFGYSKAELEGMNVNDITHPDHLDISPTFIQRAKNKEIDHSEFEKAYIHKQGHIVWGHISSTLVRNAEGDPMYFISHVVDITERKRAKQEREKLEAQFLQAQKMEAVGRLSGGVAHDFNNMLGVILGFTELAIMKLPADEPVQMYLDEVRTAAKRSADITRQLLAFARKQIIAPQVLDLNDTIASMLKMLIRLIGEDIDLLWKPAKDLWPVKMDPAQIDQILANLMVNARDAIAGVGKITIETGKVEFDEHYCETHAGFVPGRYALLAVSDNGCGMDKETLAKLFEPFFTTKEVGKGTGLGLATIYGIVKQNNGFINVYSEPGQGTTFKIYLPRQESQAAATEPPRRHAEIPTGTETVLLVEDEKSLLKFARVLLEELGYTVLATGSPREAIQLAKEHTHEIDLLMTDVVMPEMSGRDLREQLEAHRPGLKCLFMSGYTANVIAHQGVLDEGVHFVQKPFTREALARKIREVLS